ncbi:uncharacterized protein UBRO2_04851 [Ustilago bromivora]|uniref:Uncharacterized protein n=1 Tax=Ustilago bromivora TaxID=307758 RepID=A0A8H8QQI1_9BASI|nr:uncharacterized protein UBRO2_04851 [Ustilago bromivora]
MASLHNSLRSASPAPSRGLSPLPFSDASTLLAGTHPPLAPASAVFSLESHMNLHIGKIEDQLSQLLGGVKQISMTVQALAPTQPLPNPTPLSSGESATSPSACFFPWVLQDIISTIALDNLKPEHLVTLRNPESLPRLPEKQPTGFLTPTLAAQTQPHKHLQEVSLMVTSSTTQGDVVCHQALPPVVHKASTAPNSAFHFTANSPNTTAITTPNSASRPFPLNHTSHHATPDSTPMASTTPNSALVPTSLHLPFDFVPQGIIDIMSSSAATLLAFLLTGTPPPCRPNTTCHLPIFDALNAPATISSLNLTLWLSVPNLHMDQDNELHLCQEIEARLLEGRLRPVQDPACLNLICSPVGIVPKPHSTSTDVLIKLVSQFHRASKPYQTVKRNLSVLKSLHINLSQPTTAFDAARLARALQGYKRVAGNPPPTAKLPITLPLLTQLVDTLPLVCLSKHNCRMFRAAFCLAFTCFLCSGKLTWENPSSHPVLTVGSVGFASDGTFTTIFLPSSKTNPFDASVTLTVPSVPH